MPTWPLELEVNIRKGFLLLSAVSIGTLGLTAMAQVNARPPVAQASNKNLAGTHAPTFDVVSIRPSGPNGLYTLLWNLPNGYVAKGMPLLQTIVVAYAPPGQWMTNWGLETILGWPTWVSSDKYDIEAKIATEDMTAWQNQGPEKKILQSMLQTMLKDRCKMVTHHTTATIPVYALVVGKHGANLKKARIDEPLPSNSIRLLSGGMMVPYVMGHDPNVTFLKISMESFAMELSSLSNRPVVDRTGLSGIYDFALQKGAEPDGSASDPTPATDWDLAKLGLKLVPMKVSVDALMIDHIEKPSDN